MVRNKYSIKDICKYMVSVGAILVLTSTVCWSQGKYSGAAKSVSDKLKAAGVSGNSGTRNPFSAISALGRIKPENQPAVDKPVIMPKLSSMTVTFKNLDAKQGLRILQAVSSRLGSVTAIDKSNSVVIVDTQENLEKINKILPRIDIPVPMLTAEVVTLKALYAGSVQQVVAKMISQSGYLEYVKETNSLIICDTKANVEKILNTIKKIDKFNAASAVLIESVNLKFLDAKSFKTILDKMVTPYGSVATIEKTNSVIICDVPENLRKIVAEIKKADKIPEQVTIEVVILDVQLKNDTEIGVNWDLLSSNNPANDSVIYRQNFTKRLDAVPLIDPNNVAATAFNTIGSGGDVSVIIGTVRSVVHLLQEKRDVQILASPSAMVVSGQTANIKAVDEIPYKEVSDTSQGGSGALTSTKFKDVGVTMKVSATVTEGRRIFLTVSAEQNVRTGQSSSGIPIVATRKADTSLLLKDGQIVVIGGLRRREKTRAISRVPIFSSIPLLGGLFRSTSTIINNSELVILVCPKIYKGEPVNKKLLDKYNQMKADSIITGSGGDGDSAAGNGGNR